MDEYVEFFYGKMTSHIVKEKGHTFCGHDFVSYDGHGSKYYLNGCLLPILVKVPTRTMCKTCVHRKARRDQLSQDPEWVRNEARYKKHRSERIPKKLA